MNGSTKQKRYSRTEILEILRLHNESDIPVTTFCKTYKIHKTTFFNWRKRFMGEEMKEGFVSLQFSEPRFQERLFAEIELSSNVRVKLYQAVEASYFKALMV